MTSYPNDHVTVTVPPAPGMASEGNPEGTIPATPEFVRRLMRLASGQLDLEGELGGRYRVEKKIGAGGMGTVYLVWDSLLSRHVALKVCRLADESAAKRFLQEARAAAALHHPNICQVFDFQQVDTLHCLFMPYLEGEVLRTHTAPDRLLAPCEVIRIVRTVALTMQAAHDAGVIHRDLKPSNIILDLRGEPIIVDFGLARRAADAGLTVDGPMGTPAYMSPEQCDGDFSRVGPPADVYSLGAVLYELLTGKPPFAGTLSQLLALNKSANPVPPSAHRPDLDPRFDSIVLTALAKSPERRWASMKAFADALAELNTPPSVPASANPDLVLSVVGTTFAYRPPPGWTVLKVGRQRRRGGADTGNDLVIRIAGNETLSARISRHHFEVRRTATGLVVIDRSTMGLTRNGETVPKGQETPVVDGDLLGVAGVLTLRVAIIALFSGCCAVPAAEVPVNSSSGLIEIEASLGDVVTVC